MSTDTMKVVILSGVKADGEVYMPSDKVVELKLSTAQLLISNNQAKEAGGKVSKDTTPAKSAEPKKAKKKKA